MDESVNNFPCQECEEPDGVQLQAEVQHLRQHLAERDSHILDLEAGFIKCSTKAKDLEEQLSTWREKYERLYDSHKRVQKLNQVLEDKLLQMVDKMKSEKTQLTKDIATLSVRLAESKHSCGMLQKENERYKNDMNLAIQLLQCKPDNFVSHKLDNLPVDTQARVSQYVMNKTPKPSSSHTKNGNEHESFDASEYEFNISASLMSKILEDSIQDTVTKHCDTCTCSKSQPKPFCYDESHYSVTTQTIMTGDVKHSLCANCNVEIKSLNSNISIESDSPHGISLASDKSNPKGPLYVIPQPSCELMPPAQELPMEKPGRNFILNDESKIFHIDSENHNAQSMASIPRSKDIVSEKSETLLMEPSVHHKLCDRTKTPIQNHKSSIPSFYKEDLLIKDTRDNMLKTESVQGDTRSMRKHSQGSMGAISRTSSVAKSTVSANKSNLQVGPGPRFCHLRVQAGSKNILLDNAQPDVPPILYRRQSKCNENHIFKDLNDTANDFIDLEKNDNDFKSVFKNDNVVVETTLIDVHVDNNNKETANSSIKSACINPVLLNVSSSPLQPLKSHTFSNSSENNNNKAHSTTSQQNVSEIDNLLSDFNLNVQNAENNNVQETAQANDAITPNDNDLKIFNFDRYEENQMSENYGKPVKKIDLMSQLQTLENTKIFNDFPPQGSIVNTSSQETHLKATLSNIVNVYPNLTQTHLKVTENKNAFTNELSTSSLSSDDSAALLQKQQLLRVAEWVEKNLEQQISQNDTLDEDVNFINRAARRDSKSNRLAENLSELALNMPHPVSKYSKSYTRGSNSAYIHKVTTKSNQEKSLKNAKQNSVPINVGKETVFPVDSGEASVTEITKDKSPCSPRAEEFDIDKEIQRVYKLDGKKISMEELARMEYNVKKFLLSGPIWVNSDSIGRSRRTSSKTETDV